MLPTTTLTYGLGSGGGGYKAGLGLGGTSPSVDVGVDVGGHNDLHHRLAQQLPSPRTLSYARALPLQARAARNHVHARALGHSGLALDPLQTYTPT